MKNVFFPPDLQGDLMIDLNDQKMRMECKDQCIRLTFSSFKACRTFFSFHRKIKESDLKNRIENLLAFFSIDYYLGDFLIGKSSPDLSTNFPARLFRLSHTHIFLNKFFNYFFS